MKGRKPLPTRLKEQQGTLRGGREISHIGYSQVTEVPGAPKWFSVKAKIIYTVLMANLKNHGILQEVGLPALVSYCTLMATHLEAEEKMKKTGRFYTVTDKEGNEIEKVRALHKISMDALATAMKIGCEYGLTPSSQTKILHQISSISKNNNSKSGTWDFSPVQEIKEES